MSIVWTRDRASGLYATSASVVFPNIGQSRAIAALPRPPENSHYLVKKAFLNLFDNQSVVVASVGIFIDISGSTQSGISSSTLTSANAAAFLQNLIRVDRFPDGFTSNPFGVPDLLQTEADDVIVPTGAVLFALYQNPSQAVASGYLMLNCLLAIEENC